MYDYQDRIYDKSSLLWKFHHEFLIHKNFLLYNLIVQQSLQGLLEDNYSIDKDGEPDLDLLLLIKACVHVCVCMCAIVVRIVLQMIATVTVRWQEWIQKSCEKAC